MNNYQTGLISVMMPAYNAEKFIAAAIDSVLAQTYQEWELIIVNDGSQDRTGEIAGQYTDPRLKVIHQENGGEAAARNTALSHMRGEFLAFLDADDAFLPEHLEKTKTYLQNTPAHQGVYTDGYYMDTVGKRQEPLSSQRRGPFAGWIFPEVVRASDVFGPPTCTLLRTQPIFEHELQFDVRIVIGPDWDFLAKYCEGTKFGNLPDHTVLYRVHETNITVQVDLRRRAGYLALCRENAIRRKSFGECPVDVQSAVFYDLLLNLLPEQPDRQTAVTHWPQFQQLPAEERARLLRLMASSAVLKGKKGPYVDSWLQEARRLSPADNRGRLLSILYQLSPTLCQTFLRTRSAFSNRQHQSSPFANLNK